MPLMLSQTYDAFVAAGAPEDKARAAAEEIAAYENRLSGIGARLSGIEVRLSGIEATMATKAWVLGQTFALLGGVAVLLRLLH
jgi:hypothetical protein